MEVFETLKKAVAHKVVPVAVGGQTLHAKTPNAKHWAAIKQLMIRSQRETDDDKGAACLMKAEALTLELLCDEKGLAILTDDQIAALQEENGAAVSDLANAIVEAAGLATDASESNAKN